MNTLNQYTSRTVPGYVNVLGTATNTATVSLWSKDSTALFTPTTRKGDYFRGEMPFNNSTGALWLTITNVAALSNYTGADIVTNTAGRMLLAKTPETFTYDADGNLTSDSLWTNTWNGENRRTVIERRSDAPSLSKVKEQWTLLPDGRWLERIVSTNNGTGYYPAFTNRYVWDGQILLAVLDHTNGVVVSFMRGLDLSGTLQGAGGVGGVLAVEAGTSAHCGNMTNTTHFACYDGNGNVTGLMNAATGEESARYEYGPFAERLRETGPMAKLNPIRFSTQYHDDYTEDDKYLFRDLRDGRWPSRDPIGELRLNVARHGPKPRLLIDGNLYCFIRNDPPNRVDIDGRESSTEIELCFRNIENPTCDIVIGCANLIGHSFFRWPDGNGGFASVGFQDPSGKDGDLPKADLPEKARSCKKCYPTMKKLKYGIGKDKDGYDASEAEVQDCLRNRPLKGDYGGVMNNCNDWTSGAAEDCGLGCVGSPYFPKKKSTTTK